MSKHLGWLVPVVVAGMSTTLDATAQFARQYRLDCSYCHVAPPRLNERGLEFLANNYSLEGIRPLPSHATFPLMVWNTVDFDRRHTADANKVFLSRVEPISIGRIGSTRAAYFIEWRAVSQNIGGNQQLVNRSGRFEDLFIRFPVTRGNSLMVTAGQFRALQQYDVSQRLSLSEPLAFSSSVPADAPARSSRLTALRAFAPSSRQPGVRLDYQRASTGASVADGWYTSVTVPLTGELTIPLANAASFEFENRVKGLFVESYARRGTSTFGGHVFTGRDRHIGSVVVTHDITARVALVGAVGRFRTSSTADTRWSVGGEYLLSDFLIGGVRLDDRTASNVEPAVSLYANIHVPFGSAAFRQALKVQIEQRVQRRNHVTTVGLSHIF